MSKILESINMSDAHFQRIRQLIYKQAGIVLAENKREMVFNRLIRRLRQLKLNDFGQYIALLESNSVGDEWQEFVNALTTNLTSFFREYHHFKILTKHAKERARPYKVWSAAASTGEEPYSIAIALAETLGCSPTQFHVWGTDIDTQVLEIARTGIYRLDEVQRQLTLQQLQRYFYRGTGRFSGKAKIRSELAGTVDFFPLNLLDSWKLPGPFDAIFCRNVMIYFDRQTQISLIKRFVPLLKPGGLLFAGHSENFSQLSDDFKLQGNTVYGLAKEYSA